MLHTQWVWSAPQSIKILIQISVYLGLPTTRAHEIMRVWKLQLKSKLNASFIINQRNNNNTLTYDLQLIWLSTVCGTRFKQSKSNHHYFWGHDLPCSICLEEIEELIWKDSIMNIHMILESLQGQLGDIGLLFSNRALGTSLIFDRWFEL
jgi:hypothetical protein